MAARQEVTMSDREYIAALERDLETATKRAERAEYDLKIAHETIREITQHEEAMQSQMRQLHEAICSVVANTNKAQRILRGD